jgi:hypothetical protein
MVLVSECITPVLFYSPFPDRHTMPRPIHLIAPISCTVSPNPDSLGTTALEQRGPGFGTGRWSWWFGRAAGNVNYEIVMAAAVFPLLR